MQAPGPGPALGTQLHEPAPLRRRLGLDEVPHQAVCGVVDQRLARAGQLLEALRGIHRVPAGERPAGSRIAGDDLTGADADPSAEPHPERPLQLVTQPGEQLVQLNRRPHRPEGVVVVEPRNAEHRHERVAGIRLDGAAVALEHLPHAVEVARAGATARLGVDVLGLGRGLDHAGEQHGHGLARLVSWLWGAGARPSRLRAQLEDLLRARQPAQLLAAEVDQLGVGRQAVADDLGRGLRQQRRGTRREPPQSRGAVERGAEVVPVALVRLAGVDRDPHARLEAAGP